MHQKETSEASSEKYSCKNTEKTNWRGTSTRTKSNLSKEIEEESIQNAVSTKEKDHFAKNEATKSIRFLLEKMRTNIVIPTEATYSSSFEQKTGPLYSPTGSSLEFEIVGDRNNFIDLQKIYLEIKFRVVQSNGNDSRFTTGDANNSDTPHLVNNVLHSILLIAQCQQRHQNFFYQWSLRTQKFQWNSFLMDRMRKKPGWNVRDMNMKQTQQASQPLQSQLDK